MRDRIEKLLARSWPYLLGVALCIVLVSCAHSHLVSDGAGGTVLVTEGENILPGVAETVGEAVGAPVADVVGAAGEAIDATNVPEIVDNVASGRWLQAVLGLVSIVSLTFVGIKKRKAVRDAAGALKRKVVG